MDHPLRVPARRGTIRAMAWADGWTEKDKDRLKRQQYLLDGSEGSHLWAVSSDDGTRLASYNLPVLPIFDGMAVADNALYIALEDGRVICLQ